MPRSGPLSWQTFFFSILLAALVSGPLAAGLVAVQWASAEPAAILDPETSPATWSARAFVVAFDVLILATWLPCALWVSRVIARQRFDA